MKFLHHIKPPRNLEFITKGNKLIFIPPLIIVVGIGLLLLYLFTLKANVVVLLKPDTIEKTSALTLSSESSTDITSNVIGLEEVSVEENGSTTIQATGKKEIGEKAKGSITILSSLTREQTLAQGTEVTSSNGLTFVLDNAVKIASSSGLSDIKRVQASVTASEMGKEYNLPSGSSFSVGDFDKSSVEGKNDSAFSGGSKKEVTVVSQKDLTTLDTNLAKKLEGNAVGKLEKSLSSDQQLLSSDLSSSVTNKKYNKKLGDEASQVSLEATVAFNGLAYKKSDVKDYAKTLIEKESKDMQLLENGLDASLSDLKEGKNGVLTAQLTTSAKLTPKIEAKDLTSDIAGQTFAEARTYLMKLPNAESIEIDLSPNLPFLPDRLPKMPDNINLTIQPHE